MSDKEDDVLALKPTKTHGYRHLRWGFAVQPTDGQWVLYQFGKELKRYPSPEAAWNTVMSAVDQEFAELQAKIAEKQ